MQHTIVVGAPGSGKTEAIHQLIDSIRAKNGRAIIFDPELDCRAHYNPETDTILNPFDERSAGWSPFDDATDRPSWGKLGHAIFRDPKSGDPYWLDVARSLFSWTGYQLRRNNPDVTLNEALDLLFGPTKALKDLLEGTPAAKHLNGIEGARVSSLESVLTSGVEPLLYLYGSTSRFSIREWTNRPPTKKGGFLFFSAPESHIDSIRPLLGFWAEIAVGAMLSRHDMERVPTWMILDEFHSAGKIDKLADGPQRLRKYAGAVVLGFQQMSQLQDLYGPNKSRTIIGQCQTKLILRAGDFDTAELMSEQIGRRVMRRVEENTSYGANSIRDGVGLAPKEELEPICLPEDVMNFPSLQGMIRVSNARRSGAFPVAPIRIKYIARPMSTPGFVPKLGDPIDDYLQRLRERAQAASQSAREKTEAKDEPGKDERVVVKGGDRGSSGDAEPSSGSSDNATPTTPAKVQVDPLAASRGGFNLDASTLKMIVGGLATPSKADVISNGPPEQTADPRRPDGGGVAAATPPANTTAGDGTGVRGAAPKPQSAGGPELGMSGPATGVPGNDDEAEEEEADRTKEIVARRKDRPTEEAERVRRREEEDETFRRERAMADRRHDEAPMTRVSALQKDGEYLTDGAVANELGLWNNYSRTEINYALQHRHDGLSDALGLIVAGVAGGMISEEPERTTDGGDRDDDEIDGSALGTREVEDDEPEGVAQGVEAPVMIAPEPLVDPQGELSFEPDLDDPAHRGPGAKVRAALAWIAELKEPQPDRSLDRDREIEMGR